MRRLAWISLLAASVYALIWSVSWMAGDRSTVVFGGGDGWTFSSYPGVLFGGMPPRPNMDTDLPQMIAMVVGLAGITVLSAIALGRRRA